MYKLYQQVPSGTLGDQTNHINNLFFVWQNTEFFDWYRDETSLFIGAYNIDEHRDEYNV